MKKIYTLIIAFAFIIQHANSQCVSCTNYQFTKTTGAYANITGGTLVDDGDEIVPGFPVYHYGVRFDTMFVEINGFVDLYSETSNCQASWNPFVTFCDIDSNFNDSGIRYKVSGSAGNRTFVIEWRSMAIDFPGTTSPNSDHVNFQVTYYEVNRVIEFRYGSSLVTDLNGDFQGESGPQVFHAIGNYTTLEERVFWLHGNPASPTTWIDLGEGDHMTGLPANGTIYRFTPTAATSVNDLEATVDFNMFPNPANDAVNITVDEALIGATATITDVAGRTVAAVELTTNNQQLTTTSFASGVYFLTLNTTDGRSAAKKLVIGK